MFDDKVYPLHSEVRIKGFDKDVYRVELVESEGYWLNGIYQVRTVYTLINTTDGSTEEALHENLIPVTSSDSNFNPPQEIKDAIDTALDILNETRRLYNIWKAPEQKERIERTLKYLEKLRNGDCENDN